MGRRNTGKGLTLLFAFSVALTVPGIDAKKKNNGAKLSSPAKAAAQPANRAPAFTLKELEVVNPDFFTQGSNTQNEEDSSEAAVNPIFRELPHYKDNEFETQRKKDSVREKWLGRQFLIVMTPNEYKNSREIIKDLEPEVYTNAKLLEAYDFKRKLFPLNVPYNCVAIGADRQESETYERFGENESWYTNITHQICLNNFLNFSMSFENDKYPDYYILIPEKEAEELKENFDKVQLGIVVAWLPDDTGEVKGQRVDWGDSRYSILGSDIFARLELKWTAIEVFIRYENKIYQSKLAPNSKPRFTLVGHDSTMTRKLFKEATDEAAKKTVETAEE